MLAASRSLDVEETTVGRLGRARVGTVSAMSVKLGTVVVDCADPEALSRFWCDVLEWHVVDRDDDGAVEIGPADQQHLTLLFEPVPERKTSKNRLHFDINPLRSDQETELERLLALGARKVDLGQGDQSWVVLADPEGNEFCLLHTPVDDPAR
jgi:catechol-2,3-dioxygenase